MISDSADVRRPNRQQASMSFGIRGDSLIPAEVTTLFGMPACHAFAKGDEYISVTGMRQRPWGVWQLRSESKIHTLDLEEHASFILSLLEPKREIVDRFTQSGEFDVEIRIWYESESEIASCTISSGTMARLAALCNEFNFSFIGTRDSQ